MAKARLPAHARHAHDWSYDPSFYFSEDDRTAYVSRFCIGCGQRDVGEIAWRVPDKDELALILREAAHRDAHPRAELEAAYDRGFLECAHRLRKAVEQIVR
ncbi:MAG TPA: hypothetical protein VKB34_06740 [Povalibacter sp.]|nr:hypothetical protein [Povalibacter sp.]